MISIVITAYNVSQYIEEAIRSALGQTHKDIEVIVVLDKPTDDTADIVKRIAEEDERVRIVENKENVGAGLSRRYGIEEAKGEYVLLLDGDDYLKPDFIEVLYDKALETDADIVTGCISILREDGTQDITLYGDCVLTGYDKITKFWGTRIVYINNRLIRRSMYDLVPYCHRRYIEDTPVIIPLLWYANKVAFINYAGYVYRMQEDSLTHKNNPIQDFIYKSLCWCDLVEFFNEHDKAFFDVYPIRETIRETLGFLNSNTLSVDAIAPYANEWAELTLRMFNLIKITGIDFKQPNAKE